MDGITLRGPQAPFEERYQEDGATALVTLRAEAALGAGVRLRFVLDAPADAPTAGQLVAADRRPSVPA